MLPRDIHCGENPSGQDVGMNRNPVPEVTLDPTTSEAWDELSEIGRRMLDDMIEYVKTVRERPAWRPVTASAKANLDEPLPWAPTPLAVVYDQFRQNILPFPTGNIHPRFWGWVMGNGTVVGMLAEMLAAGMNAHVAGYDQAATVVEKQVVRWLVELMGFPPTASGLLVSGGTAANLVGLAVARNTKAAYDLRLKGLQLQDRPRMLVYGSAATHSWATKCCELLGLGRTGFRAVPVNAAYEIDVVALRALLAEDRRAGHQPFCVIGNLGTVNTGATDDLRALAALCRDEDLWFHIDGAFGALAVLSPKLRSLVAGMEEADSLAFDLHKWGYIPYEIGCVLVKDEVRHRATFASSAAYLHSAAGGISVEPTYFADLGVQLSRGFRALKVWMSLKTQGVCNWGRMIQQNVEQAQYLTALVDRDPELERNAPAPLNVVCFRFRPSGVDESKLNELNRSILVRLQESGIAVPSGTTLDDRFCLRVANTNHRSTRDDFIALVEGVKAIGRELINGSVSLSAASEA